MKKNDIFLKALVVYFVLFMIFGTLAAQNYAFKCDFDFPIGSEIFPVTLTKATAAVNNGLLKITLDNGVNTCHAIEGKYHQNTYNVRYRQSISFNE